MQNIFAEEDVRPKSESSTVHKFKLLAPAQRVEDAIENGDDAATPNLVSGHRSTGAERVTKPVINNLKWVAEKTGRVEGCSKLPS